DSSDSSEVQLDRASLLARVEGDRELLRELAAIFLEEAPGQLAAIREAVWSRNAAAVSQTAHALVGCASNFGAERVADLARQLEQRGRDGDLDGTRQVYERLAAALK